MCLLFSLSPCVSERLGVPSWVWCGGGVWRERERCGVRVVVGGREGAERFKFRTGHISRAMFCRVQKKKKRGKGGERDRKRVRVVREDRDGR